jgi:hypothetical protein
LSPNAKILQSEFNVRYLDIILEARFNANRKYPKEGFFVAIGGKLGMQWGASTTVEYQEDNETKKRTMTDSFNINSARYGLHAKLGWGRFSAFYAHTFSSLFKENKGPGRTQTCPYSMGISIDLF